MEKLLLSWARVNVNTPAVHVRVGPLRRKGFGLYSSLLFHSSGIGTRRSGGRKRTARMPSGLTRKICGQWCTALLHEFSLSLFHSFFTRLSDSYINIRAARVRVHEERLASVLRRLPRGRAPCTCISMWSK